MRAGALGFVAGLAALLAAPVSAQLSNAEQVMVETVEDGFETDVALLEGSVLSECHTGMMGGLHARLVAHVERALCPRTRRREHAS